MTRTLCGWFLQRSLSAVDGAFKSKNWRTCFVHFHCASQDQDQDEDTSLSLGLCFHGNHGKNIMLSDGQRTARRTASYNQGVVVSSLPLPRNRLLEVRSHCTQILDLHSAGLCSYCSIPQRNRFFCVVVFLLFVFCFLPSTSLWGFYSE